MKSNPKNKTELLENLEAIAKSDLVLESDKNFALALAYIIGDICPDDRTTKFVFRKREGRVP